MPDPEFLRVVPLVLFPIFFLVGVVWRPVFFPISYMTLWLTKLSNYYPFVTQFKVELIVALVGLVFVFMKSDTKSEGILAPKNNYVHKYLLMLLGCMFLSFMVAWDMQFSWDVKIYDFIKVIILYFMITLSVQTEKDLTVFIWFFVLFYCYLAYEPVYGFINGVGGAEEMYGETYIADSGILSGHVALANNMNQMLPFAFFLYVGSKNKFLKILAASAVIIFLVCLVGSKSRGGVAGFLMLGVIIVYFSEKKVRNAVVVLAIGATVFLSTGDMEATLSRIDSSSAHGRFAGLEDGFDMILKGNLLGVGPGCYILARRYYHSYGMESHNIYGQVMGDLGIPGTIVAFLFVRQIFVYLFRSRSKIVMDGKQQTFFYFVSVALIASLITRLFVSLASHGLYFFYYYVIAALSVSVARISGIDMRVTTIREKVSSSSELFKGGG